MATGPFAYGDGVVLPAPTSNLIHGGWFDYNDSATSTTPISVTGGAGFVDLTNDELGPFTNKTYKPDGVTDVWDAVGGEFDWTELSLGDTVEIRLDLEVTTTISNQEIEVVLAMAQGSGGEYNIPFVRTTFKSSGANDVLRYEGIYMGDTNTRNFPAKFQIQSPTNCTVVVRGWYCNVTRRG